MLRPDKLAARERARLAKRRGPRTRLADRRGPRLRRAERREAYACSLRSRAELQAYPVILRSSYACDIRSFAERREPHNPTERIRLCHP